MYRIIKKGIKQSVSIQNWQQGYSINLIIVGKSGWAANTKNTLDLILMHLLQE